MAHYRLLWIDGKHDTCTTANPCDALFASLVAAGTLVSWRRED